MGTALLTSCFYFLFSNHLSHRLPLHQREGENGIKNKASPLWGEAWRGVRTSRLRLHSVISFAVNADGVVFEVRCLKLLSVITTAN
jgi:hypothetical protein